MTGGAVSVRYSAASRHARSQAVSLSAVVPVSRILCQPLRTVQVGGLRPRLWASATNGPSVRIPDDINEGSRIFRRKVCSCATLSAFNVDWRGREPGPPYLEAGTASLYLAPLSSFSVFVFRNQGVKHHPSLVCTRSYPVTCFCKLPSLGVSGYAELRLKRRILSCIWQDALAEGGRPFGDTSRTVSCDRRRLSEGK